jgi:hypothetical protein
MVAGAAAAGSSMARQSARTVRAKIAFGHDVSGEQQERKSRGAGPHRRGAQRDHR